MGEKICTYNTVDFGHGRIEERKIEVLGVEFCDIGWPGLMQVGRITRTRTIKRSGKSSTEQVLFITSLPQSSSTVSELLGINRNHWGIENRLFWVKDNVFMEDRCTVRAKNSPDVLVALRNFTLKTLKSINFSPTIAREICSLNPHIAINQCLA